MPPCSPRPALAYEPRLLVLCELLLLGHRQRVSSLTATGVEDVAATLGGHAGEEAELADALDALRLVCALGGHAGSP